MSKKSSQLGFTILEVSVAVALLGVITYFISSLFVQSGKSLVYVNQKNSSQQVQRLLGQSLSTFCSCQFYGLALVDPPAGNIAPLGNQITAGCTTATPPIQSGQVIIQKGSAIPGANNLTVSDIELSNLAVTSHGASTFTGNLVVSYSANTGPNASITLANMTIPITIQTSGGLITACSSSYLNSSELWALDSATGNIFYTHGNVGIGTGTPSQALEVNGNVKAGLFVSNSDRRLKTNIRPIEGLDLVLRMQGRRFTWLENQTADFGVIAQEMEEALPEAVVTDAKSGYKSVKYQNLVAPLIEATKELYGKLTELHDSAETQNAQVEALKQENSRLKSKISVIESRLNRLEKNWNEDRKGENR